MVISSRRLQLHSTCEASKRFWMWSTHSRTIYQSKRLDETYTPVLTASGSAEIQKIDLKCGLLCETKISRRRIPITGITPWIG